MLSKLQGVPLTLFEVILDISPRFVSLQNLTDLYFQVIQRKTQYNKFIGQPMQEYDFKDDVQKQPSLLEQCDLMFKLRNEDQDHLYGRNQDEKKFVPEDSTGQGLFQQEAECQKVLCQEDLGGNQLSSFINGNQDLADNMEDENKNNEGPTKSQHQQHDFGGVFSEVDLRLEKNNNYPKHLMKHVINRYLALGKYFFMGHQELSKEMNTFVQKEKKMYKEKNWNNNLQSMKKIFGLNEKSKNPKLRSQLTRKMTHHLILQEVIPELKQNRQIKKLQKSYLFTCKTQLLRCRNADLMCRVENH